MQVYTGYIDKTLEQADKISIVALYNTHKDAEDAICELRQNAFNMKKLSIVGLDTANRMKSWDKSGVFWGGLWGMLFGSAVFHVAGLGPLMVAGPIITWLVRALEDEATPGRMNALATSLYTIGVPKSSVIEYEKQIKTGKFIVIAYGLSTEVSLSKATLVATKPESLREHRVYM